LTFADEATGDTISVMSGLSHLDAQGRASMVDVGDKPESERRAVAEATVRMSIDTLDAIAEDGVPKGDVIATAQLAGIMAAKRTGDLIPLCHPLSITHVRVDVAPDPGVPGVRITAEVSLRSRTGVEMEALTAVSVAALTVYDMCKAIDRGMEITDVRLLLKEGGTSGTWRRPEPAASATRRPPSPVSGDDGT
jgi:cyclic pyranopterin monophosphate synthase